MNAKAILTALVVLSLCGLAPTAAAQTTDTGNETSGAATPYVGCIDDRTCLVGYDYSGGTMTATVESEMYQRIVLSDTFANVDSSGGFSSGGASKTVALQEGRTNVSLAVTEYSGVAGIDIGTSQDSATITEQTAAIVFHSSATWGDVQATTIFVAIGGFWLGLVIVNYLTANRGPSAERVN